MPTPTPCGCARTSGSKSIDASPVMPNLSFSWVRMCASSALRSSAFDGMHPTLRQTPPQYFSSMTATFLPSWAARIAATYPPGPAPRTTTSKCSSHAPNASRRPLALPRPGSPTPRARPSGGLGDPVHRVAGTEVGDAGVAKGAENQHPPVRGERQHVGDHPAVREGLRRVAEGVDERLVQPAVVDDLADLVEERRPDRRQARPGSSSRSRVARRRCRTGGRASTRPTWPSGRRAGPAATGRSGSSSTPSTEISTGASSCSGVSRAHRSTSSPTSQTWCSTMRVSRSIAVTFRWAGSRRPPGGSKCTSAGRLQPVRRRLRPPRATAAGRRPGGTRG